MFVTSKYGDQGPPELLYITLEPYYITIVTFIWNYSIVNIIMSYN